jgi:NTE family protein
VDELVAFLRALPLLADISDDDLAELGRHAGERRVLAGEWLFRQGDAADALFMVRTGRLEVLEDDDDRPVVIRRLGRGAPVGDLALLTDSPRSRSVRAVRDTELVSLDRKSFEELLHRLPEVTFRLARALAQLLQTDDRLSSAAQPRIIGLVVADEVRDLVLPSVVRALSRFGQVGCLEGDDHGATTDPGGELDRLENANDLTVLVVTGSDSAAWTQFCLRQADVVAVVASQRQLPLSWSTARVDRSAHVLFLAQGVSAAERALLLGTLQPLSQHVAAPGTTFPAAVERLVRRMMGSSLGLVLSAGGARGFAHIGVIEAFEEAGIDIDRVGGCSMGAFIGALLAMGLRSDEITDICRRELVERNPFNDYTIPRVALLRARRAQTMLERVFGGVQLQELPIEYFSVSCDLLSARVVQHRTGPATDAIGASMSLPGLVPPLRHADGLLVDGGLLNALPIDVMAKEAGPIVAVDVTGDEWRPRTRAYEQRPIPTGWRATLRHLAGRGPDRLPRIDDTLARISVVGSRRMTQDNRRLAHVLIAPTVGRVGVLEFRTLDEMIEAGRVAGRAAIETVKALSAAPVPAPRGS